MTATASSLAQFMAQHTDDDCVQAWQLLTSMRPHLQDQVLNEPLKRYSGHLNEVNPARGYGFIVCPDATLDYGRDCFVSTNETGAFQSGHNVKFTVVTNKMGQPQARLLEGEDGTVPLYIHEQFRSHFQPHSQDPAQPPTKRSRYETPEPQQQSGAWVTQPTRQSEGSPEDTTRYLGTIASYIPEKHCGFIKCTELYGQFQKDVFLAEDELKGYQVGDSISFRLVLNHRGHPQAREVGPPEHATAHAEQQWQSDPASTADTARYVGTIQSLMPEKHCAFIQCGALYGRFKKDVFVSMDELQGYDVGHAVSFRLVLNAKGHPQARELGPPETIEQVSGGQGGDEDTRYSGNIQTFIPEKHCGFIHCKALYGMYQKDIFVAEEEMLGYEVGHNVSFRLTINARGMPQARDLGPPGDSSMGPKEATHKPVVVMPPKNIPTSEQGTKRYAGNLQSYIDEKKCGFIHCAELYPLYKKDVFVSADDIWNFKVGDALSFRLTLNARGHPQAREIGPPHSATAADTSGSGVQAVIEDESARYVGRVASLIPQKHCGFINCPYLYPQFNKDVFVSLEELGSFEVGDEVSFRVVVSARGHPQAREVDIAEAGTITGNAGNDSVVDGLDDYSDGLLH